MKATWILQDFLQSLSQASRGTVQEKLRWIFCLYDLNGDGFISKAEMTSVAGAIYEMLGRHASPPIDDQTAGQHIDQIFHVSPEITTYPISIGC